MQLKSVGSIETAERLAILEAANTLSIVAPIHAIDVRVNKITLIVGVSSYNLESRRRNLTIGRPTVGGLSVGGSYMAAEAVDRGDMFGFVVLRTPIRLVATNDSWDGEEPCRLAIELPITEPPLANGGNTFGSAACSICNGPISNIRIAAIPNTRLCTKCKKNQETTQNERTLEHRRN